MDWSEKGVHVIQGTVFPASDVTTFVVRAARPTRFALRVRVPYWATGQNGAALNGRALEGFAAPSGYYVLDRPWRDGDRLEVRLPMSLHAHPMPDDPTLVAMMYGPMVLAGKLGTDAPSPRAGPTPPREVPEYKLPPVSAPSFKGAAGDLASWVHPVAGQALTFRTSGQAQDVTLVPFHSIFDERYAIYWKVDKVG